MGVNEWHLIVCTVIEETGTYYTDGVRQGQVQGIFKIDPFESDIQIGFMSLNSYVGAMDELRIYNRVFDQDEVLELFEKKRISRLLQFFGGHTNMLMVTLIKIQLGWWKIVWLQELV